MPTFMAHFTQIVTKQGTLEIEAETEKEAIELARELADIGDHNEEIGWDPDAAAEYDMDFWMLVGDE